MLDSARGLSAILDVMERLGVEVRQAVLGGDGGGLCQVKDRRILFVDTVADPATQYAKSLRALAQMPEVNDIGLPPFLRAELDELNSESPE